MHTAKKIYRADEDGVIHVDLPVGQPGGEVELLLVWNDPQEPAEPPGDLGDLVGLLKDTPLERPPQGEYERRDTLAGDAVLVTHNTAEFSRVGGLKMEDWEV